MSNIKKKSDFSDSKNVSMDEDLKSLDSGINTMINIIRNFSSS